MKVKNVVFEYYRVYARVYDKEKNSASEPLVFDISGILEDAILISSNEREYEICGEVSRLQEIENDEKNSDIWKMSFVRIRKNDVPRISKG